MANTWYPVIDYGACVECGACISKCPHGVYATAKAPWPVGLNPQLCVDHCHGCGNRCPVGAITYVGDDTGWTPPNGRVEAEESACCCGCGGSLGKKAIIEYLYLDLQTCDRCIGTDKALDTVMMTLTPALRLAGYAVTYNKVEIKSEALAREYQFLSSPTIRVNGRDVCVSVQENDCGCCSDISGTDVACRVFEYNGETYEVAPEEMLAQAILQTVFGGVQDGCCCESPYELPANLKAFFEGKTKKAACACTGGCC